VATLVPIMGERPRPGTEALVAVLACHPGSAGRAARLSLPCCSLPWPVQCKLVSCSHGRGILDAVDLGTKKKNAVELRHAAEADDQGGRRWKHRLGAGGISNIVHP